MEKQYKPMDTANFASLKARVQRFIEENGREPSAKDFDACPYLTSARTIQRRWGGLKAVREQIGLKTIDHTTGDTRKKTAEIANKRANQYEQRLYTKLHEKYNDQKTFNPLVIRDYAYQQYQPKGDWYKNIRCDVAINYRDPSHIIMIDFFYPSDVISLGGCVRSKKNKLIKQPPALYDCTYEVLFVCVNKDIPQPEVDKMQERHGMSGKIKNLAILSLKDFCDRFNI